MGAFRRLRSRYSRLTEQNNELQARLDALDAREREAADEKHKAYVAELEKFKADAETAQVQQKQAQIRERNANAILEGVADDQRDDVALMLAGLHEAGKIDLNNEADDAGAKLRAQLEKDRPAWFKAAANAGPTGPTGTPGTGLATGPLLGASLDQLEAMTEEQLKEHFQGLRQHGPVRL